jgi:hypothetical protein
MYRLPGPNSRNKKVLELAVRRLSPCDHFVGDDATEITELRDLLAPRY